MRNILVIALLLSASSLRAASLYDQAVGTAIARKVKSSAVSYLLVDALTGSAIAVRWQHEAAPVPSGSLLKPFAAIAYAEGHGFKYPQFVCHGAADGCWLPRGHGQVGIVRAIQYSCNAYFLRLASRVQPDGVQEMLVRLGISAAPDGPLPGALVGLGRGWEISPIGIARAYLALSSAADEPGVREVIEGMERSARAGTARAIGAALNGRAALAKTGTAPCVHRPRAPGDGYTVALYPARNPQFLVLVQVHGVPGSAAARIAGTILALAVNGQ